MSPAAALVGIWDTALAMPATWVTVWIGLLAEQPEELASTGVVVARRTRWCQRCRRRGSGHIRGSVTGRGCAEGTSAFGLRALSTG